MRQQPGRDVGSGASIAAGSALDVQILSIDSYTAAPTPADCALNAPFNVFKAPLPTVPVIRIFGATGSGQRICLHVHQVWPYMYVQYTGPSNIQAVREFGYQLGHSLNTALNLSLKGRDAVYVAAVVPVKGVPFYGHSAGHRPFLRIQFANASVLTRASSLLAAGAVMGQKFDIFESHLPFTLQFLVDYNLYGMSWMSLESVRFRAPLPPVASVSSARAISDSSVHSRHRWVPQGVPSYLVHPTPPERTSSCELEADAMAASIINRTWIRERHIHHDLYEGVLDAPFKRLVPSLDVIWAEENMRRARHGIEKLRPASSQPQEVLADRSNEARPAQRWSNHWKMQSLFASALADDQHLSKVHLEADPATTEPSLCAPFIAPKLAYPDSAWLDDWPTCREADLGYRCPELGGIVDGDYFYFCSNSSGDADNQLQGPSQASSESAVDAELVALATPKRQPMNDASDSGFIPSSPGRAIPEEHNAFASDNDDSMDLLDDMDDSWLEQEVLRIESAQLGSAEYTRSGGAVPQLDGASDSDPCGDQQRSAGRRVLCKRGQRRLQPLDLQPKSMPTRRPRTRSIERAERSASTCAPRRAVLDFELVDRHRSTFNQIVARDTAAAASGKRPSGSPMYIASSPDAACAQRPRRSKYELFVDIPHPEGSVCGRRGRTAPTDRRATASATELALKTAVFKYVPVPPTTSQLRASLTTYGIPEVVAPQPRYSAKSDAPKPSRPDRVFDPEYAPGDLGSVCVHEADRQREERAKRRVAMWGSAALRKYGATGGSGSRSRQKGWWAFARRPPNPRTLVPNTMPAASASEMVTPVQRRRRDQSDLKWGSVLGKLTQHAPLFTPSRQSASQMPLSPAMLGQNSTSEFVASRKIPMSLLSAEILTSCRPDALPNPKHDSVVLISTCFAPGGAWQDGDPECVSILWTCEPATEPRRLGLSSRIKRRHYANEADMLSGLAEWTCWTDPDALCGYEIQRSSWGYLIERAESAHGIQLEHALSRLSRKPQPGYNRPRDSWGYRKGAEFKVAGRHVLNVWRLLRNELSLTSYAFENTSVELLGERSPHHTPFQLAEWFLNGPAVTRIRALRYTTHRSAAALRMLHKADIVARASEFASVIGIDFNSVLTRGSQLRVESLMARIAHPELFIMPSPTREQVAQQRAAECLPLVLEPQSDYYTDPVIVLDFQSLYPSVMIAYNYCFSTCLGSLEDTVAPDADGGASRRLGFTNLNVPPGLISALQDHITVSPNGMVFVNPSVRQGLLGRMLQEILDSRVMIKDAMKRWGDDEALRKKLDAWQLGLKLIANVTYGYAGASFSGRMPCVEVADAIVQSGRETLESAIRLIHSRHAEWGGKVVYGDTDSVFVWLPGRSRQDAFRIGQEIAAAVTQQNPAPVQLKFEKVYQPCVLLTKKRYAGWMYKTADQTEPQLDVKGMVLVRRDGCTATQRILEGAMSILFGTNDLSALKSYVVEQITQVLSGRVPMHEFIIAKEVRMHTYSGRMLPAHAKVAADGMGQDPQAEPEYGERVPYVVVSSSTRTRLVDRVISPRVLLAQSHIMLDYQYYVDKQIAPALDRLFSLIGVDVRQWISQMP
ncbi:DNA polymerase zeta, partial [Coemansia sp. RSA 2702]